MSPPRPEQNRVLTTGFWLALFFGVLCVGTGMGFAILAPKLAEGHGPRAHKPAGAIGKPTSPR